MNDEKKQIIIIHDEEKLEMKFNAAITNLFNLNEWASIRLNKMEVYTILGLIKEHKMRKQDGEYKAGMMEGYIAAIKDATKTIGSMKPKL